MTRLLLDSQPLIIIPELAQAVGLNEAIILQQVHYWVEINKKAGKNKRDGHTWTYNTFEEWQEQFPFWSLNTIKRAIGRLKNEGIVITGTFNKMKMDRTTWYRIDYEKLQTLVKSKPVPLAQNGSIDKPKMVRRIDSIWPNG